MTAAIGALVAILVVVSCAVLAMGLTRSHRLRDAKIELSRLQSAGEASLGYTCTIEPSDGEVNGILGNHTHVYGTDGNIHTVNLVNPNHMTPTASISSSSWSRQALQGLALVLLVTGCGPSFGAGDGWEGSDGETGDGGGAPIPGDEVRCVELVPGQVSCWVSWELAWARVMLPCQVAAGVEGLAWTEGYDDVVSPWGAVVCHDTIASEHFCLYGDGGVLLTEGTSGWVPEVSALVGTLPVSDPPCGLCDDVQPIVECEDGGLCWAWLSSWSAPAQYNTGLLDGLVSVDILPGAKCYQVVGPDGHLCTIEVDCVGLIGRPVSEMLTIASECAELDPWTSIIQTDAECFGVVGNIAVLLNL